MENFIDATPEQGKAFYLRENQGELVMLNLLRFRAEADYSALQHLQPNSPISGQEAYEIYMDHTRPFLEEIGSEVLFYGRASHFLIGPADQRWDAVLLVKHPGVKAFLSFAQNKDYLAGAGHRTAALADSRLLPIDQVDFPFS